MKPKILLIEDNEQNTYLMTFLLEKSGFFVEHAATGAEGIAAALRATPDLVLLDIQLPDMTGYEVATDMRRQPALGRVPIAAVTSFALVGDREKALAAGCNHYFEKPIDPDTFPDAVRACLKDAAPSKRDAK